MLEGCDAAVSKGLCGVGTLVLAYTLCRYFGVCEHCGVGNLELAYTLCCLHESRIRISESRVAVITNLQTAHVLRVLRTDET